MPFIKRTIKSSFAICDTLEAVENLFLGSRAADEQFI